MKLRITHNSIRIRVRKSELSLLQSDNRMAESIEFPSGVIFKFVLVVDNSIESVEASFEENTLQLSIPKQEAEQWINTNEVGIETNIDLANGKKLHILIEKDFPCIDRPNEDKSDTFWELASEEKPDSC